MTLLPIIYTSLFIFFSLLALVAIISYISYKTRSKENPVITEEKRKINKINIIKHQIPQPVYSYQLSQVSKVKRPTIAAVEAKQKPIIVSENYFGNNNQLNQRKIDSSTINNQNNRSNNYQSQNIKRNPPTTNRTRLSGTRLEIMNNSAQFQNTTAQHYEYKERNYVRHDITQTNILSFYQDQEEPRLAAINALPIAR